MGRKAAKYQDAVDPGPGNLGNGFRGVEYRSLGGTESEPGGLAGKSVSRSGPRGIEGA
jgi:hypothetical protein